MDCPNCNSQDIEIGESKITGTDFTAKVWYASCHATIGEDVNWGGGYDCEFFIVRESEEVLLAEVQRLTKRAADVCHSCGATMVLSARYCHVCGKPLTQTVSQILSKGDKL